MDFDLVRYVALGPRLKIIIMNILPESKHNELKYSLNIAFLVLSIIVKMAVDIPGTCYTHLKQFECILNKNCGCTSNFVALIFDEDK